MAQKPEGGQSRATGVRPPASSIISLDLDGSNVGLVSSVEGGEITGLVVEEATPSSNFRKKHIAGVKYEDVTVTAGLSLDAAFYDWIANTLNGKFTRKDGTISTADWNFKVRDVDEYFNALISEVTFPKVDASSKDAVQLTVKFSPEYTRHKKGSGAKTKPPAKGPQKVWHASNFRLAIDGLVCNRVSKVEALTVKQTVARDAVGEARDQLIEPGRLDFPNLVVTLPEVDGQTWLDWHEDFVVKGNNGDAMEKNGTLTYLSADLQTTLGEVQFSHLGIFKLTREKVEAGGENIRRLRAEMYVEEMSFSVRKQAA